MRKVIFVLAVFFLSISLVGASRMPTVGGDNESWGAILNDFLNVSLNDSGYLENNIVGTSNIIDYTITDSDIADNASINASKLSGLSAVIASQNFSAANILSGILSVARGGTGFATYVVGDILYANSTSTLNRLAIGNATQVLIGGSIPNWTSLTSSMFGTGVILSDAIANRNITSDKIAIGAINATHLAAGTLSGATNLTSGSVNGTHIANGSISSNHLAANSVNTTHIINGTIVDADISSSAAINASKIAGLSSAISISNLSSGVLNVANGGTNLSSYITGDLIYANSSTVLARLAIGTAAQILIGGTVPTWGSLTASMIGAGIINTTHLANNVITSDKIAPGAINATHLASGAISGSVNLTVGSVNSTHILDGTIIAIDIAAGVINTSHISSNTIQGANINTSTNLTVAGITVGSLNITGNITLGGVIDLNLSTVTDDCSGLGCTATATCPAGKKIIIGFTGSTTSTCDTSPLVCNGYCTTGATSCAVTEDDLVVNVASVRIVCGRL